MAGVVSELEKLAVGDAGEKKVVKTTTTDEFYVFVTALNRFRDDYEGIGIIPFNPDFIRKMFGPLLLDKRLRRSDGDIREAVNLWCSDRAAAEEKHGHISHWDVSRVTDMSFLFQSKYDFNEDISAWDTSNVTDMERMFISAWMFNQPIGGWDVSKVQSMEGMFCEARALNQPIGGWDVSKVQNMYGMFFYAEVFNQPIGGWDVSKVQNTQYMFCEARAFNQPIGGWDVSKVPNMQYMLCGCPIEEGNKPSYEINEARQDVN
jgi:surface protein